MKRHIAEKFPQEAAAVTVLAQDLDLLLKVKDEYFDRTLKFVMLKRVLSQHPSVEKHIAEAWLALLNGSPILWEDQLRTIGVQVAAHLSGVLTPVLGALKVLSPIFKIAHNFKLSREIIAQDFSSGEIFSVLTPVSANVVEYQMGCFKGFDIRCFDEEEGARRVEARQIHYRSVSVVPWPQDTQYGDDCPMRYIYYKMHFVKPSWELSGECLALNWMTEHSEDGIDLQISGMENMVNENGQFCNQVFPYNIYAEILDKYNRMTIEACEHKQTSILFKIDGKHELALLAAVPPEAMENIATTSFGEALKTRVASQADIAHLQHSIHKRLG